MKLKLFLLAAVFGFSIFSQAQTEDKKLAIGIYTGISDYRGELNQQWFNINTKAYRAQVGATIMAYVSPFWNAGVDVGIGPHGFHIENTDGYRADILKANFQARLKFNNGKWMKQNARFQPYLFAGLGAADVFQDVDAPMSNEAGWDFTTNAGLGFNVMVTDYIGLNYNLNWAYTSRDYRDHVSNGFNDQFMIHSLGIVIPVGKIIDTDGDGVGDKRDQCPNTPTGVQVDLFGCPLDADGDGTADYQDACPDAKGLPSMKGCPDTDGDGITDAEDACPTVKGVASAKGCPDADGDGIQDAEDACPKVKGIATMKGCPDTDGDGITDADDACPTEKGSKEMNGCPDTDGDGISDNLDKCPKIAGTAANNGCPEIKAETQKVFDQALKGVQFETAKAIIKPVSFGILDNVASIMKDNPTYNLDINGHTDNQGDDAKNMTLSQERAASVKAYLVSKGIEASRMESYGFGETQPKATNDTAPGRAENRRVEFKVRF
ncbi:MAG: thrombospondin type 3 repeat-containing protein [Crocinitomicaceae bacterium]